MNTNTITIVGGGSAGWMTAATLIKAFPNKKISVIESKNIPIVGVGESTILGIRRWTRFIGLDEETFFSHADASLKLSIKFTDFYKKDAGSFHYPFSQPLTQNNENPFSDWHIKKYFYPETDIEDFVRCLIPSTALFENNRFSTNTDGNFDNYDPYNDVAYHFDAVKFGSVLRDEYCIPAGVNHIVSTVTDVICDNSGISKLILEDGSVIESDLYIDCTGFKSLLLAESLQEPFDSLSNILPNNKAWACRLPYKDKSKELEGFTNCTAIENGWCWNIPLWSRLGTGYVYSDKYISKEKALEEFKNYLMSDKMAIPRTKSELDELEYKEISMRTGIHKRTFVKNVVAIGLSAGFIEPLESNGLFSVHEFLFKLVDILQRGKINQFDRDMYNTSVRDLFDNFAKFVALHYALSHRDDSDYWRDIQQKSFPDYADPQNQFVGRTDTFYNMAWRYMEEWAHPYPSRSGITYISTGMNLNMMNSARIQEIEYTTELDLKKRADEMHSVWEARKQKWRTAAANSPSLEEYLQNKFYSKDK
jgi:tryptophan halogenase